MSAVTISAGTASKSFRPDIEGLRALAVLGVIAFHFGATGLPGGFVGVDIFFVISGYLITRHLQQEIDRSGGVDLWAFYARRARRLLPASLFVIVATLVAGYFILSPGEQELYSKGGLFASTYIINLWLIRWSLDYFAQDASNNPFIHFWSLSVEEQFYLAWPALLLLFTWMRPGRHGVFVAMATVAAVSFALCAWLTEVSQPWAFYFSPLRAWEFALGGLASMALLDGWAARSRYAPAIGWVGLALIAAAYVAVSDESPFPGFIAVAPAAGAVMVLLSGVRQSRVAPDAVLALPPVQWVGKLSYSLYLWHWPVIVYATILAPDLTTTHRLLLLVLTFALSLFSYHFIENPIRRNAWLIAGTGRSLGFAALITTTGAAIAFASATLAGDNLSPQQRMIVQSAEKPSAARALDTRCVADAETVVPEACRLGAANGRKVVVLFGDSHADHWSTPLSEIAGQRGWRLLAYIKSSCPAASIDTWNTRLHRAYAECNDWRAAAIEQIKQLRPSMVIISEFSTFYVENGINDLGDHLVDRASWDSGVRQSVKALSDAGIYVAVLRDVPLHKRYLDKCVARALWQGRGASVCDTPRAEALDDSIADAEKRTVSTIRNARYVDLTSLFCDPTVCPAMVNGKLAAHDRHHIAEPFAASLAAPLERAIFMGTSIDVVNSRSPSDGAPGPS